MAAVLCLTIGQLITGIAAATFAGWTLFYLAPKAFPLFVGAVILTIAQAKLLKVILHLSRKRQADGL